MVPEFFRLHLDCASIKADVIKSSKKAKGKIYLYAGKQEGKTMIRDLLVIVNLLHYIPKQNSLLLFAQKECIMKYHGERNFLYSTNG